MHLHKSFFAHLCRSCMVHYVNVVCMHIAGRRVSCTMYVSHHTWYDRCLCEAAAAAAGLPPAKAGG